MKMKISTLVLTAAMAVLVGCGQKAEAPKTAALGKPMTEARGRPLDADEQALIAKADKAGAAAEGKDGIAGFCLGRLFALYVPEADGTLLVADAAAVYRLQRLK